MIGIMKQKNFDSVQPYGYFLIRKSDGLKYVGVRYANVKLNLTPSEDFARVYFTSGKLKKDFKRNPENYTWRLCYTFNTIEDMFEWERKVTLRVYKKPDWANQGWCSNYGDNPEIGKLISTGKRKVGRDGKTSIERGTKALKEWLWNTEDGREHRARLGRKVSDAFHAKTPEQRAEISAKRMLTMDFKTAAAKAHQTLSKVGEDGLTGHQRNAAKATKKMLEEGTMSSIGKKRNETLNRKVGEMTEEGFAKFVEGKAICFINGMKTRRQRYQDSLQALDL